MQYVDLPFTILGTSHLVFLALYAMVLNQRHEIERKLKNEQIKNNELKLQLLLISN